MKLKYLIAVGVAVVSGMAQACPTCSTSYNLNPPKDTRNNQIVSDDKGNVTVKGNGNTVVNNKAPTGGRVVADPVLKTTAPCLVPVNGVDYVNAYQVARLTVEEIDKGHSRVCVYVVANNSACYGARVPIAEVEAVKAKLVDALNACYRHN